MGFKKGHKHSQEIKDKIRETHLKNKKNVGKNHSPSTQFKKGQKPWNTGLKGEEMFSHFKNGKVWNKGVTGYKIHTEEHKEKLRKSFTGNKYREGKEPWNKGTKGLYKSPKTPEVRKRISDSLKGHPCYKDKVRGRNISIANKKHYKEHPERAEKFRILRSKMKIPMTDSTIEIKVQNFLKDLHVEFLTHQHMKIDHAYQCDVYIPSMNLVIECDGDYWHGNPNKYSNEDLTEKQKKQKKRDSARTKELIEKGYRVIRIWENEIRVMSINDFKEKIMEVTI